MANSNNGWKKASYLLPNSVRNLAKRLYLSTLRFYYRYKYVSLARGAYLGRHFRISVADGNSAEVGARTNVDDYNVWDTSGGSICIGQEVWIGLHNIVMGPVEIDDQVSTGPHVRILGPRHAVHGYDASESSKTTIGRNVWISTGVIVMAGVSIGENSVIAPASVVTKDVPANSIVAGNPARDITRMTSFGGRIAERGREEPRRND